MTETEVEDYTAELQKMLGNFQTSPERVEKHSQQNKIQSIGSNVDDQQQYINESPFRSSQPTIIDRKRIMGFEKTGQLLRKIKRELSNKNFDMQSKQSRRTNKVISTQHSIGPKDFPRFNWNENQKDEMTEAIMDNYEKQIITLKAEVSDLKEEKKQIKQTLQNERRLFMAEMYSKEIIIEENQIQIQRLRDEIDKHTSLEYQFQQKIRLLQLQNSQYKYELQRILHSQNEIEPIDEKNQDFLNDYSYELPSRKRKSSRLFASLGDSSQKSNFIQEQKSLERIKLVHQRQIAKYQRQIKHIRQFYEIKLKALKNSITPKIPQKKRVSINILDEYVCRDSVSCQSQGPQNLRSMLRQQMNFQKSNKKFDDTESYATVKYFKYPLNTKKRIQEQQIFIRQPEIDEKEETYSLNEIHSQQKQLNKFTKVKEILKKFTPSIEFLKGFGIGGLIVGASATLIFSKIGKR